MYQRDEPRMLYFTEVKRYAASAQQLQNSRQWKTKGNFKKSDIFVIKWQFIESFMIFI